MKRTNRRCDLCEHTEISNDEYPCEGCLGTDAKPNFVEKKAQDKLEYIRMKCDLLEQNVKELEKLAFGG